MTQLDSDFDLVAHLDQDSAANQLLGRDGQEQHSSEPLRASAPLRQSHTKGSFVYPNTEIYPLPSEETVNQPLAQTAASSSYFPSKVLEPVHWKGNAWYALTGEFFGIIVALCFLGGSYVLHTQSIANV
jgi:hypothetical protein